ncbi:MAG: nucleotidyltransferase family protein [Deltaproteobacteria bacterium]|nr:nucleotidyltransferase family protein [Deltaproteobacteria bacterium]
MPPPSPQEQHAWLLGAGPKPRRKASAESLEGACDFVLKHWQVIGTTAPRLLNWVRSDLMDHPRVQAVRDRKVSVEILGRIQLLLMKRLGQALTERRIPYVLLKGSATRLMAFDDPLGRCGYDIDLGVPGTRIREAEDLILELGFWQAELDFAKNQFVVANPRLRASVESHHYELGFLARRHRVTDLSPASEAAIRRDLPSQDPWHLTEEGGVGCFVSIDVHHGLCLDVPIEPVVHASRQKLLDDIALWVPAHHWMAFHLIYKLYWEGVHNYAKGGFQYADLCRLLPKLRPADVPPLLELLHRYLFEVAGYFVLRRVPSLGVPLPPGLASFVQRMEHPEQRQRPIDPVRINDLGDMWPKLWGGR